MYSPDGLEWQKGCGSASYTHLHQNAGTGAGPMAMEGRDFDSSAVEAELRKMKPAAVGKKKVKLAL